MKISTLSRRQLGTAGAFGGAYMLVGGGRSAQAGQKNNQSVDLEFVREQTRNPGLFITDTALPELQFGFGPNVFSSTPTSGKLLANGQHVLKTTFEVDAPGNVPTLTVGMKGSAIHTAQDRYGGVIHSTTEVESINDVPDDFLATGKTKSRRFTGAYVHITTSSESKAGRIITIKTTYNLLTQAFPLGVNVVMGPAAFSSNFDPEAALLSALAVQTLWTQLGSVMPLIIPSGLQQDISFGDVVKVVAIVANPVAAIPVIIATSPPVTTIVSSSTFNGIVAFLSLIVAIIASLGGKPTPPQPQPPGPGPILVSEELIP
jgi:hypothetical protein